MKMMQLTLRTGKQFAVNPAHLVSVAKDPEGGSTLGLVGDDLGVPVREDYEQVLSSWSEAFG